MLLGGVLLAAGTEMVIAPADHTGGPLTLRFLLTRVVGTLHRDGAAWVVLDGRERPHCAFTCWRELRIEVRVDALKRSMSLGADSSR